MSIWLLWFFEVISELGTTLDRFGDLFVIVGVAGMVIYLIVKCGTWTEDFTPEWMTFGKLKYAFVCVAIGFCLNVTAALIPSREGVYRIVGAYFVTNIDGIGELPENLVDAANAWVKEYNAQTGKDEKEIQVIGE